MQKPRSFETETKLEYIDQELLDFDPSNPRFGGSMENRKPEEIQKALFEKPYFASELVESFLKNGFIDYEPLVVRREGQRFTVIEGNRRLAAIREILANPNRYKGKTDDLKSIPALVFPDKPDDEQKSEMRVYLGIRHLNPIREWPSRSKAVYLDLACKEPGGLDRALEETQLKKVEARRFLVPYRLLKHVHVELPAEVDFWMLGEALSRTGIKKFLQLEIDSKTLEILNCDKKSVNLLLDYLYGPIQKDGRRDVSRRVVEDTRDLSRLSKVLGSEKAIAALRKGSPLEEAEILVDTREESIKRLAKVTKELGVLIGKLVSRSRDEDSTHLRRTYEEFKTAVRAFTIKEH
ncbi:ParB N-terminal domain-containing protein [candidate division KSB1 bacterium]|nr:ParB N-terminal domain-containing protein [candidate division KSB1 bacterium]